MNMILFINNIKVLSYKKLIFRISFLSVRNTREPHLSTPAPLLDYNNFMTKRSFVKVRISRKIYKLDKRDLVKTYYAPRKTSLKIPPFSPLPHDFNSDS